ncbi:MAG: S-methyl-5'-thioadenosine phosphorylase [Bacteroidota bacterium]
MRIIGIIGGSGLENPDILKNPERIETDTPYGKPSSGLVKGTICGKEVVILSRHGFDHSIPPTLVNNRANIWTLREAGCSAILATTACGSLREEIGRGHIVFPDQFIDFTRLRKLTYFEEFTAGELKHTPMADPFSPSLRKSLIEAAEDLKLNFHRKGTVITIEGPRFSTRAESHMFRQWGGDVINMSTAPEVILANELGISYAAIAMSTDYDCWKEDEEPVTWEDVISVFHKNVNNVTGLIVRAIEKIGE